jgi:PAS domain S-box-containing protein
MFVARKQAEKRLHESEQKYRILFSGNPQPMLVYDFETLEIMEANQTAELFYGYNREEFLRMSLDQLHPKSEKSYIRDFVDARKLGLNTDIIYNHIKKNGESVFVETSTVSAPTFGPNARHVLIKDVTERKKAEAEVLKSLSLLNATIESTADGILVVDAEGKTTLYNQKFAQMWGIPNELLEVGIDEQLLRYVITKLVDPDQFLNKVTQLYKNPELSSVDNIQLTDGRTFVRHSIPQRIGDLVVGRVWSFRDITDRLIAENKLLEKMNEMTRLHNLTIGRELTMIELKKEINELLKMAGKEDKYKIVR